MKSTRTLWLIALSALLIALVATLLAGDWLWSIAGNRSLQAIGPWLTPVALFFTFLGDEQFYLLAISIIYWCVHKGLGADLGVLVVLSPVVNAILKSFIKHPRPFWQAADLQLGAADSFSTPSGHAQNTATLFGYLALFLWRRSNRIWSVLVLTLLIVLVSLSRVYLGVHFAGDVIWGAAIGIALAIAYAWVKPLLLPHLKRLALAWHIVLALLVSAGIFAVQALLLTIPFGAGETFPDLYPDAVTTTVEGAATVAGLALGLWLGLVLENRYVHFSVAGPVGQRILRYLVGIVGLFVIWLGLRLIFPSEPAALGLSLRLLRYALAMFWAIAGWPWLFVKVGLGRRAVGAG